MATLGDLLMVLHQIDYLRGKVCGTCRNYRRRGSDGGECRRGHEPFGPDDGCDDWVPDSPRNKCA